MTRRERRRSRALARGKRQVSTPQATAQTRLSINFGCVDRKALLLGTALVSTFLFASISAPTPAQAVDCFAASFPAAGASGPITVSVAAPITCVNTVPRANAAGNVIDLETTGPLSLIHI